MSTRCTIHFEYAPGQTDAIVYRHGDGYPDAVLPDLEKFFAAVEEQTKDTRFGDPSYLAAKFIVWQASRLLRGYDSATGEPRPSQPLDFIGVAPVLHDPGDIEFRYHVLCTGSERPKVQHEEA
jgi:hypothetical protein